MRSELPTRRMDTNSHALRTASRSFPMLPATPIVFVVDDDPSVREALESLIVQAGWRAHVFESAQYFLSFPRAVVPSCLVLDVTLLGLNGLELQSLIAGDRIDMPIIFITGHADVPSWGMTSQSRPIVKGNFRFRTGQSLLGSPGSTSLLRRTTKCLAVSSRSSQETLPTCSSWSRIQKNM
jgi:CheY-like chemotaxis protein